MKFATNDTLSHDFLDNTSALDDPETFFDFCVRGLESRMMDFQMNVTDEQNNKMMIRRQKNRRFDIQMLKRLRDTTCDTNNP